MSLFRLSSWRATASLLTVPLTVAAQPLPEEELALGREVVVTGAPGERPAVVYGAANVGVQLVFDAPLLRTDAGTVALQWPGGEVRLHPYMESSLFVIPSRTLSTGPAVPLHVALTDGGVPLVLVFRPGTVDHILRILRRPPAPDAGTDVSRALLQETLGFTTGAIFTERDCAPLQSRLVRPQRIRQPDPTNRLDVLVCAAGMINYVRVTRGRPACDASTARLLREGKDLEVLHLESVKREGGVARQALAVWSPTREEDFELLLLAADGAVCERVKVMLAPGGSP
jgi:hypothetical protein